MDKSHASEEAIQKQFDWSDTTPCIAIIEGIAALENMAPTDLADQFKPLFEYVDTDALETLVTADSHTTITFNIEQYTVRVDERSLRIWSD